jgi:hypothetical protein
MVNGAGSVCDQKTYKFLSCMEESMAGHVGINGVYGMLGKVLGLQT